MKKEKKEQVINELKYRFDKAKAIIFTDYRGLTVAELSELRRFLRDGNLEYRIVKNTLAKIASQGTSVSIAKDSLKGPLGIAFSYDDPVIAAKKILEYSKRNEKLKVSSGVVEGRFYASDDLRVVAEIQPRHVLLSTLAGGLEAPINKLARALSATITSFAYATEALKIKKVGSQ